MQNQRVHVLVVAYPAQGHLNPLIQFAKRLASKGVKATVAATPYTINSIHPNSITVEPISDGFDEGGFKQAPSVEAYLESFKTVGSRTLAELIAKFNNSGEPVSCVVYDSLLFWAVDVAKEFGIRAAMMLTNSASVCSLYWQINQGRLALPLDQETLAASVPGLPSLSFSDMPSFLAHPTSQSAYLALIMDKIRTLGRNDWVFCNSFEELESELVKALKELWPVITIGPLVPSFYLDHQIEGDTRVRAKKDEEGIVRREELGKCLREVMVGEKTREIKSSASKWREHAKTAVSVGGSSDRNIDEFIRKLLTAKEKKA
ncbi:hypothetical protein QUC31_006946 [Theobroma cacao]